MLRRMEGAEQKSPRQTKKHLGISDGGAVGDTHMGTRLRNPPIPFPTVIQIGS